MVELSGYIGVIISFIFGWINLPFALLFLALVILFGVLLSLYSLLLEEFTLKRYENARDVVRLFFLAVLENFGYRQLHSWWRLKAYWDFSGRKGPGVLWKERHLPSWK
ncbi:hypothetical protein ACFLUU_08065 [Chloroflexota bacterium]